MFFRGGEGGEEKEKRKRADEEEEKRGPYLIAVEQKQKENK